MKKKNVIWWIIIVAIIIISILLYMHYTPVWVSISNVIFVSIGIIIGWFANILYVKFIKNK